MTTDPDQIRVQISELLAEVPGPLSASDDLADDQIDILAARLEQAHDLLVHALESVEKG